MPYAAWQHIAVTRAENTVKFYINGQLIGKDQLTEDFPVSDNPLIIGHSPERDANFSGKMDDLRIYKRSLSQEEVVLLLKNDPLNR
jgi:hypothetical protein